MVTKSAHILKNSCIQILSQFSFLPSLFVKALSNITPEACREALIRCCMQKSLGSFRAAWVEALHHPAHLFLPRFEQRHLDEMVNWARSRFKEADEYLLADRSAADLPFPFKASGIKQVGSAAEAPERGRPRLFYCVYESDASLSDCLHSIMKLPNAFYYTPKAYLPTARVFHRDEIALSVLKSCVPQPNELDTFDLADWESIIQALKVTRHLPGAYVEIGVYKGASAEVALHYLDRSGMQRPAWFLDLFEGFSYDTAARSPDAFWLGQFGSTSLEGVARRLQHFPNKNLVRCNIIDDSLPPAIEEIAVCNIDVDLYEAVISALEKTAPLMVKGGVILVEDQGHTPNIAGGFLAVKDFLDTPQGQLFFHWDLTSGQALLVRK